VASATYLGDLNEPLDDDGALLGVGRHHYLRGHPIDALHTPTNNNNNM
jgi:hypothetical protein